MVVLELKIWIKRLMLSCLVKTHWLKKKDLKVSTTSKMLRQISIAIANFCSFRGIISL